ncbi:MAG TPA: F420-nonreducing hydrogenase [Methanobacteriales archaeon]|jgi:F420-non-reducing hydrogenase subunit G|nr:MAG: F420-non-reducing hydrogenase subunit G [Methanobacteriaceae archaeon 41_258]MBC7090105.1 F420-nonreducing hydrogenase [Methanobacteriaceae archaeon]MBC7096687.1 F420-nonreducing hydrogenase [Methanobacteriales archaeon]MDI3483848.1 F420-non-reducing hydrogenase small subunit [Methanobacteriaceae archaeon]HIH61634.1 F420-nonreducing hydrogenase [Methanobacteriales archaeon]
MAEKAQIGTMWLGGCSGCHLSIVDFHEQILDLLELAEIKFSPVLMDIKYDEIPEKLDVVIIEGGIVNDENREFAELLRERADFVISYGTCAAYGGIPGLRNLWPKEEVIEEAYINSITTPNPDKVIPSEDVPHLEDRVRPLSDVIDVDLVVPGCPPKSDVVAEAVIALLKGEEVELPNTNLCEVCPREKPPEGLAMDFIKRQFEVGKPEEDLCLIAQGIVCMGPATVSVCGAQCPSNGVHCRGCYGPTTRVIDQGAKMISAIASDFGVERDKKVDPEEVAEQLDDILGTFYTYTLPAALIPMKIQKEGK